MNMSNQSSAASVADEECLLEVIWLEHHPVVELIERLRRVTLRKETPTDSNIFVYRHAKIRVVDHVRPDSLVPAQYYRVTEVMRRLDNLRRALALVDIDMFHLNGYVRFQVRGQSQTYTLLPPIVEYQQDMLGQLQPTIVDGLHRVSLARKLHLKAIQTVEIAGVWPEWPYYGYPNPNGWRDVRTRVTVPEMARKRLWRVAPPGAYRLYRDFNGAFGSVGDPRQGK